MTSSTLAARLSALKNRAFLATVAALLGVVTLQACTDRKVVAVEIASVTVQPGTANIFEGDQLQLRAVVEDVSGRALPRATIVWESQTPGILSVDGEGMSVGLAEGSGSVEATFRGVTGTATVTVLAPPSIELRLDTLVLVDTDTLVFRGGAGAQSPPAQVLQVRNGGQGNLGGLGAEVEFGVGQPEDWLTPLLGANEANTTLTLTPQTATLPVGLYDARVRVSSPDDDDSPRFVPVRLSLMDFAVTETDGSTTVGEAGGTDSVSVVLLAAPDSTVVMDVSTADSAEITVSPRQLTFSPANWNQPQGVTVTGEDDLVVDGDRQTVLTLSVVDSLSDAAYDPIPDKTVSATSIDDDIPGFSLGETGGGTTVTEAAGTDEMTVVLLGQPLSPVTFDVTARDASEASVAPGTVTFDGTNWDVEQTVTVTGEDDFLIDGSQLTAVVVSVDAAASDDLFDPLDPDSIVVTTTDDDTAGFTVAESDSATIVSESGATDDFTVVLDAEPTSAVTFTLTNPRPDELSLGETTLTFTPANWNTPQSVVITGVDDELFDGNQDVDVVIAVDDASSDDAFDALPDFTLTVSNFDDDTPGFTITESGAGTTVTEAGSTDDFEIVLGTQPQPGEVVVLDVTSLNTGEVTVDQATLTFNPTNWFTAQTVTVTGVNELIDDDDRITPVRVTVDTNLSDPDFAAVPPDSVLVTTTDDDEASFTIQETGGGTLVTEEGATDDFTIVLGSQPTSNVVFSVVSLDTDEVTVDRATVTFTPATWNQPLTVTVTGVDDLLFDGDQFTLVAVTVVGAASDDVYDPLPGQSVNVTTADNDAAAGIEVTEIAGTIVEEGGGLSDDFIVRIETEPASNVVLDLSTDDPSEIVLNPTELTFTPTNWNDVQAVVVQAVDDDIIDGSVGSTITIAVNDAASDDTFDGIVQSFPATTIDDDVAGLDVIEVGGTSVTESGSTDDFTVALTAEPGSNVVVTITSQGTDEASVSPGSVTFTAANWDTPRTITVTGVDDAADDGDQTTTVDIAVDDAQSDDDFDGQQRSILVTTSDDDGVGFTITEQGSTTVSESGSSDTFTVELDAQPVTDVEIDIVSTDIGEATVGPATLTFTNANWDTPRTVTVTSVDDDVDDGDQVTPITVTVDAANSDPAYGIVPAAQVLATTTDDDAAGFVLAGDAATTVTEAGSSDPFTVVLSSEPVSNVVIDVTSADIVEATVSPAQLTFTPANWDTEQTVTVTGAQDLIDDGDQVTTVTVAVNGGSSDDTFDPLPPQTVDVTTQDDDTAGLTLGGTGGLTVSEAGSSADFTVVLDAQPVVNVVVQLTSGDPGEATVTPSILTFTPSNWSTEKTATVVGVDDAPIDGNQQSTITVAVDDGTSDDAFDGLTDDFQVTTTDDDVADFTIQEFGGTRVNEGGSSDEFTVVLDAEPSGNVVFDITSSDTGEATVNPSSLIFTPGNWNSAQTVTVTGVDDLSDDGDVNSTVTIAADPILTADDNFDALSGTVIVTTIDDDGVGFTVTEIGSTTVPESGLFTDNFTVTLDAQPLTNVVVDITSSDLTEVTVGPPSLTFGPGNWDQPQTVTVSAVDDDLIDGDQDTNLTIVVDDAQSDDAFDGLSGTLVATTTDDDVAGFTLNGTAGLSVSEAATQDGFTVQLDARPTSPVVIDVTSLDATEVSVSPASITFLPASWDTPRTVTLTGVDDPLVDAAQTTTIRLSIDQAGSDDAFDAVPNQTTTVTTTDDDVAGLTVTETGGTTEVAESGTTDTFTIELAAQPALNVVVTITSGDPSEASVSTNAITFTPATWNVAQTIIVTGAQDLIDDGDQASVVSIAVDDANSDNAFDGLTETVNVTTTDDDTAGFVLAGTAGLSVNESGTSDGFTAVLGTQPTSNVQLSITTGDVGEVAIATTTVTFTPANWNAPRTITVVGVDDIIDDGDQSTTVTIAVVDANSDDAFDGVANQNVSVTTVDDDDAGFALAGETGLSVSESGTTDDFTVVLTTQPESNVVLDVTPSDTGEATVTPTTLTFTPGSWNLPQTVTIQGVDDDPIDGDQNSTVTVAVDDALSDDRFDGLTTPVTVTTTDDDTAGLTVIELGGTRVTEAGSTDDFTISLTAEPASNVVVDVVSTDTDEATVSPPSVTFTSANWDTPRTITVTGVDDAIDDGDQITTVTITVNDASSDDDFDGLSSSIQVTTTDDDGVGYTITEIGGTQVDESGTTDQFAVELTSQPGSNVVIDITSTDLGEAIVDRDSLVFTSVNWNVQQAVTVTGVDDELVDGLQTTPINVAINAAWSDNAFDLLPPDVVQATTTDDDAPDYFVTESGGFTSATEGGAADAFDVVLSRGPLSNVVLTVTNAAPGQATIDQTSLTFTPGNWQTPQTVTFTAVDDVFVDGSQPALITVSVDDAASDDNWDPLPSQSVAGTADDDDIASYTLSAASTSSTEGGATDAFTVVLDAGPVTDVVFNITSADPAEASVSPSALTFTSTNWATPQPVTVTAEDDPYVDGPQSVTLTVAVNTGASDDAWDALGDQTVTAQTVDNDVAGYDITESLGNTTVTEGGLTTDDFTVVLSAAPLTPVAFTVTSADTEEAIVDLATLDFDDTNWDTPQTVTVSGGNDVFVDGAQTTTITVSVNDAGSDPAWDPLADQTVEANTNDDDVAGFDLTETAGGTTVPEDGSTTDQFTVVLTAGPLTPVVLDVATTDAGEATVNVASLTFDDTNWNVPQPVTVSGIDDDFVDGNQSTTLNVSVDDANSDAAWDPLPDDGVSATTTDDDDASFTVTGPTTASEDGASGTFTVVLDAGPVTPVEIDVNTGDPTEAAVDQTSLTFTAANWATPQVVTVTADDDEFVDGNLTTTITMSIDDPNSDDAWDAVASQPLVVTTFDNDDASFTFAHTGVSTVVSEGGTTDDVTVVLDAGPVSPVIVDISSADPSEATVEPSELTFTSLNWDQPQTVTVTGVNDDPFVDGDQTYDLIASIDDAQSNVFWDPLADQTLQATTTDNTTPGITVAGGPLTVNEAGTTTDDFTVRLSAQPVDPVTVNIVSNDTGESTVSDATLTFTNANWSTPQTVTVTGVTDYPLVDGDQAHTITVSVDGAEPAPWNAVTPENVAVTTTDDTPPQITVTGGPLTVLELGPTSQTFTVELGTRPVSGDDITVLIVSSDTTESTVDIGSVTFTNANWDQPVTITVTAVVDGEDDDDQPSTITVSVDPAEGLPWTNAVPRTVSVTTVDAN